ncbi:FIP (Fungus-Induced Protein) Related [Caenorhabditis elegans]|uniref:FIP (Fungus-Induced Protein) Related n=1 Tax=Caenorhabditis elegans TaxID=6239 RepID=G3MU61_CAEEL|nr:FIP (Fungus-Induced Protein) Related [Caenorhabditis elegans]CCD31048.1 FIP (Fungus-Induced Protein) Related [Caenorhabditis elegans]|eukprot:NP_001256825.1 Uncharacterized protein CELE_C54E10.11 [Caenorhabditis elegans]
MKILVLIAVLFPFGVLCQDEVQGFGVARNRTRRWCDPPCRTFHRCYLGVCRYVPNIPW